MIEGFEEEFRFLSNFYVAPVTFEGRRYPSSEHAFQAAKCAVDAEKDRFTDPARFPGWAKREGQKVVMLGHWNEIKLDVMQRVVLAKFMQNPDLKQKLLATGEEELVEVNDWHDNFWGDCRCLAIDSPRHGRSFECQTPGQNHLGYILMRTRDALRESERKGS